MTTSALIKTDQVRDVTCDGTEEASLGSRLKPLRIVHVGPFWDGSTSLWRREALQSLGHEIIPLDITPFESTGPRLLRSLRHRLSWGPGIGKLNRELLKLVENSRPDVVLVDKGLLIRPKTLQ